MTRSAPLAALVALLLVGCSGSGSATKAKPSTTTQEAVTSTTQGTASGPVAVSPACSASFDRAKSWQQIEDAVVQETLTACGSSSEWLSAARDVGASMEIGTHTLRVGLLLAACGVSQGSEGRPACRGVQGSGERLGP